MNKDRRKELARAQALIDEAQNIILAVTSDEQDAFDSMPESLQNGPKGEALQEKLDKLEELNDACIDMRDGIEEVAS